MRVLFALPGFHRHNRGAEVAFISIASELARLGDTVTLIGSGHCSAGARYRFLRAVSVSREVFETFPFVPPLRNEYAYEEATFIPDLLRQYHPKDYDVTVTCSYPFTNWVLRRPVVRGVRPPHIFVTQNGDWPAVARNAEYRLFGCEGLVCTNPQFYERNKSRWRAQFIPNGVDCDRFSPGPSCKDKFGLPENRIIVLMVSALIESKRVETGIEAVNKVPDAHLVVAGDGPLRRKIETVADRLLPGRFTLMSVSQELMPSLYRSANVFMHLSKDEPSSLAFLEALACGLPVVAHDIPQLRYIAQDDEFLGDTDDPNAIAARIKLACDTSLAKVQRRTKKAAKYSWTSIGAQYRLFMHEIIGS